MAGHGMNQSGKKHKKGKARGKTKGRSKPMPRNCAVKQEIKRREKDKY